MAFAAEGLSTGVVREQAVRVSIIIVNYNGGEALGRCLPALELDRESDREIIVVDNASTDGSADQVTDLLPQVRLIKNPTNAGFGGGNNLGARYASGEYLVFLNPDTVVEPGWLEVLIRALDQDQQAGLVTPKILLLEDPERINTCGNDVHISGLTLCRGMGAPRGAFNLPGEIAAVSGAAFAIRRALFEALGGFDEDFFLYLEDTDLSWRARLAGWRCLYAPDSVVNHDYSLKFGQRKTFYLERNRYLMLLKNMHPHNLLVLLPALLLAEAVAWGFMLTRERQNWKDKLHAYTWIFKHWCEIQRKRQRVQAQRRNSDADLLKLHTHRLAFEQIGNGLVNYLAHWVFDLQFFVLKQIGLILIRG